MSQTTSRGEGDKLDGHPGLLFKVDYAPHMQGEALECV